MSWVPNAPTGFSVLPAFVNTPTISTSSLPTGEAGAAYSFQLVGTGGTQPYTWSATGLPSGLTCSTAGVISGTPSATFSGNVTLNLSDAASATAPPRTLPLSIIAGPSITTTTLPQATVGIAYSFQMAATGGTAPYTWGAIGLPAGLGISSLGLISGTPTTQGTPTVAFTATDALGAIATKSLTLTVILNQPVITTSSLPVATVGVAYSTTLAATGGVPPYTWLMTGSAPGLTLSSAGVLSGTPTTVGTDSLIFTVTDSHNVASSPVTLPLTVQSASSGAFIPQAGFTVTGTFAWDGVIQITDSNNRFGPNGPVMLVFDDFRNGTPGATMGPSAPVSGIGSWIVDTRSPEISPYIFGPANSNAAGTGPCVRALNNEVSGAGGVFARGMEMFLGGEYTQLYSFRNERWNGWNGRNNNGGGGGYYKMEWFLDDGSFGSTAFDVITPVFIETTTQLQPANIVGTPSWSATNGGEVTVTVNTGGNCFGGASSPPLVGSTFTAQIGNSVGGNYATFTPWVPAAYNGAFPGAVVTATGGSPGAFTATFTYPLAANPGPVTTKGTLSDYGAYGTGVPSLSINTCIGGNSSGKNGLPGGFPQINGKGPSSWNGTAFANDTWDQNGWNSIETYYLADQTAPATNNGIRGGALFNAVNNQAYNHIVTPAAPLMGTPSPPWGSFNNWRSMGLLQDINANGAPITIDRSDHIVFLGNSVNSAAARFMLHDQPTLAASTMIMPLTDYSGWSPGAIGGATLRQGRFPAAGPAGAYMSFFAATAPNTQVLVGQFTPAVFDYFISTTGSDANAGTTPGTAWSLNAINTKQATYAGKKVGIVAGTYSFTALGINQAVSDFGQCALQIATGTATSPTVIASCDTSGNYSPRAAIFDCGTTLANNPNQGGAIGTYGSPGPNGGSGYITIDGLEIKNAISAAIQVAFVTGVGVPSNRYKGIIIQNNYIHNITLPAGGSQGANLSGIECYACDGAQILNNYLTDIQDLVASNPDGDPNRSHGIKLWTSINCSVRLNTVYAGPTTHSPCGGVDFKNSNNSNNEVAYNFIHLKNATNLLEGAVVVSSSGGNSSFVGKIHHNIIIGDPAVASSDLGTDPTQDSFQIYQNTFVGVPNWSVVGVERFTGANLLTHYGNIYNRTTANTQRGDFNCNVDSLALTDFNWFPATPSLGLTASGSTGDPAGGPKTSISAWAAAITSAAIGKDAHSLTSAATFANASATGLLATDYQLPGTYGNAGTSAGAGTSSSTGQVGGAAVNMGAWDGVVTQIGCSFMSP